MPVFAPVTPPVVTPATLTGLAAFRASTTPRNCTVSLFWWQSPGVASAIRASDTSAPVLSSTTMWLAQGVTATAPADATEVSLGIAAAGLGAGELIYSDERGIFPGVVTTWAAGGYVGNSSATVLYSDDGGVTWSTVRGGTGIQVPATTQLVTLIDYEAIPNTAREYEVTIQVGTPPLISLPSTPVTATITTTSWWLMDPTDPTTAFPAFVSKFDGTQMEQSSASIGAAREFLIINSDVVNGKDGTLSIETVTAAESVKLENLVRRGAVLWLTNPYGEGHYVRFGPMPGGMTSGNGNKLIQSSLSPSEATTPYRVYQFTYVEQPRPAG